MRKFIRIRGWKQVRSFCELCAIFPLSFLALNSCSSEVESVSDPQPKNKDNSSVTEDVDESSSHSNNDKSFTHFKFSWDLNTDYSFTTPEGSVSGATTRSTTTQDGITWVEETEILTNSNGTKTEVTTKSTTQDGIAWVEKTETSMGPNSVETEAITKSTTQDGTTQATKIITSTNRDGTKNTSVYNKYGDRWIKVKS
jgi:hypothetical protein